MLMVLPYETVTFLPFYVADAKGYFDDEGLDVSFLYSISGGVLGGKHQKVRLAVHGEIAFFTSVSTSIEAVQREWGDVVAVASSAERPFYGLVRAGIESVSDLRGKTVMTGGGASRNELLHLIAGQGWTVGQDIILVRGDAVDRMNAFRDPDIHAVAGRTHYLAWARREGFAPLRYEDGATWFEGGVAVAREFLEARPDAVRAMVRGLARGTQFVRDPANREEAVRVTVQYVRYMDEEGARTSYDVHREHFSLRLDEAGLRYMAGVLAVAKGTRASWTPKHLDMRFLEELDIR